MFAERAAKRERRPKRARAMVEDEMPSAGQRYCISTQKYCISTQKYYTVNSITKLICVSVQEPIRKQEKEAGSLCLTKSWPTPAARLWNTTELGETATCLSPACLSWPACLSPINCLSAHLSACHLCLITDLPSVTGSVSVWTGSVLAAPGKSYLLSLSVTHVDLKQSWDCLRSVLSIRFKKKWEPRWPPRAEAFLLSFNCKSYFVLFIEDLNKAVQNCVCSLFCAASVEL